MSAEGWFAVTVIALVVGVNLEDWIRAWRRK